MLLLLDAAVTAQRLGFGSREYDSDVGKFKRECFQNGFGRGTKKFSLSLLWEGEERYKQKKLPFQIQVGFRGVEEKKSLDLLLGEKPVDLARIQNFCLRFPLPSIYRTQVIHKWQNKQTGSFQENLWKLDDTQVWKLCLGILPRFTSSEEYVWLQRSEQYNESER